MSVKKRSLSCALCLVACLMAFPAPYAAAAEVNTMSYSSEIMPILNYIADAGCKISVSNGTATIYTSVIAVSTATKCKISIELQEKSLFSWKTVESNSTTKKSDSASLTLSKKVTSGKSYRAAATVTVWSGSQSESVTIYSDTKTA